MRYVNQNYLRAKQTGTNMLIGIHAALTPDLLRHLRAMGHGDTLVIADANFPAEANSTRIERLAGVNATDTLKAVLSLMPLDTFVDDPFQVMQVVGDPSAVPDIVTEFQTIVNTQADTPARAKAIDRQAFYVEARKAYVIVQTAETRLYGNIILSKGVVAPK